MAFNLYPAKSDGDIAFFHEEEYQSALENQILLQDRSAEDARQTFIDDLNSYLESLTHNQIITARTENGDYAGMVWLAERTSKEPWDFSVMPAWIYDIRVRPEFRGSGLGRLLLQKAEEWAAECGLAEIGLHVFSSNTVAINLYHSSGYRSEYKYLQKEISAENLPARQGNLQFRPYQPEQDEGFTRQLLFQQYQQRATGNGNLALADQKITAGFTHCLETYNFGNQKKELIIAEDADADPIGLLWFYNSKGDLGKRRYIWLHSALAVNPDELPHLLAYLDHWAADHLLDAIRTPVHRCESGLISALDANDYQPSNLFMLKRI